MKRFTLATLLAALLPLAACNQPNPQPTTPPPPNNPAVDVQAPGVSVKSDRDGTSIRTPGPDIEINKK